MQAAALLAKDDKLFAELAALFQRAVEFESQPLTYGPDREERTSEEKEPTEDVNAGSEEIVPQDLVGTWSARRGTATRVDFSLQEDGTFTWTATSTGPAVHYAGKYAVSADRIVLSGSRGTVLAWVKDLSADRFRFQLVENDPADTGIEFTKEGSGPGN
jgi:hypothetical protein